MIMHHIKFIWFITKHRTKQWYHDITWHFSHVNFYAKRISVHMKQYPYDENLHRYWMDLPLDKSEFPFDKEKAQSALREVNKWIEEDKHTK